MTPELKITAVNPFIAEISYCWTENGQTLQVVTRLSVKDVDRFPRMMARHLQDLAQAIETTQTP